MPCSKPPACSGALRQKIDIQFEDMVDDGAGGQSITWTDRYTGVKAYVEQMGHGERFVHQRLESQATHKFVIRYRDGILASDRISWNGETFNIDGPPKNWEYKNRWLTIYATSGKVD